jgi:hypothetical protein
VDNLLRSSEIGVIFLDRELRIRKFTPAATTAINLLETDVERPVQHITHNMNCPNLLELLQRVVETEKPIEQEVRLNNTENHLLMRLYPYLRDDGQADGVVITFVNINEIKQVQEALQRRTEELEKLYNKNQNKLYYVAKLLDANSAQYKKSTPNDIIYDNMDKFINGEAVDKDKRRTAQKFLDAAGLDLETLKIRAIVKDAGYYKMIATKADGFIYHMTTSTMMGRNPADAAEFLKNPLNEQILVELQKAVEVYWNQ